MRCCYCVWLEDIFRRTCSCFNQARSLPATTSAQEKCDCSHVHRLLQSNNSHSLWSFTSAQSYFVFWWWMAFFVLVHHEITFACVFVAMKLSTENEKKKSLIIINLDSSWQIFCKFCRAQRSSFKRQTFDFMPLKLNIIMLKWAAKVTHIVKGRNRKKAWAHGNWELKAMQKMFHCHHVIYGWARCRDPLSHDIYFVLECTNFWPKRSNDTRE